MKRITYKEWKNFRETKGISHINLRHIGHNIHTYRYYQEGNEEGLKYIQVDISQR